MTSETPASEERPVTKQTYLTRCHNGHPYAERVEIKQGCPFCLHQRIATLTRERDEARADSARLEGRPVTEEMPQDVRLCIDLARKDLAARTPGELVPRVYKTVVWLADHLATLTRTES